MFKQFLTTTFAITIAKLSLPNFFYELLNTSQYTPEGLQISAIRVRSSVRAIGYCKDSEYLDRYIERP